MNTYSETYTLRPETPVIPCENHPFTILNYLIVENTKYQAPQQTPINHDTSAENPIIVKPKKVGAVKKKPVDSTPIAPVISSSTLINLENIRSLSNKLKSYIQTHQVEKMPVPVGNPINILRTKSKQAPNPEQAKNLYDLSSAPRNLPRSLHIPIRRQENLFFNPDSGAAKLPKAQHNRQSPQASLTSETEKHLEKMRTSLPYVTEFLNNLSFNTPKKPDSSKFNFKK